MSGRVVVGVDGSEFSTRAVRWAAVHALRHRADLRLVRAYQIPPGTESDARHALRTHVRRQLWTAAHDAHALAPDVTVEQVDVRDDPLEVLALESVTARTLVVGARGIGGFGALLLGSVSDLLADRAECPLVVARGPASTDDTLVRVDRVRPVVVGVDGSPASEAALAQAFAEADAWSAPLVAVHAWNEWTEDPVWSEISTAEVEEREVLAERLAGWTEKYPGVRVSREVVRGTAAQTLVARSQGARVVVVGALGRRGLDRLVTRSTRRALLHHAQCPVMVVRPAP